MNASLASNEVRPGRRIFDTRPNKALDADHLHLVLEGYPHLDPLINIAERGIAVQWGNGLTPRCPPPKNHGSFRRYLPAITKALRSSHDSGQYMIINTDFLDLWSDVICSPFEAVENLNVDPSAEVRPIHDLSFPKGDAVNDAFRVDSVPKLRFRSVAAIEHRIEHLVEAGYAGRIRMLKGDVKTAFRH
ncbi:hypothetical protein PHMEG_0004443 [Phytophthora megakarya]|uniref:Uncharacterized protein n=1 Tax=Phytophthora megakarya TaxID=4795 RepID=A0A225WVF3_9STRA|nr:hypothetical protein PHMEG_0004443 [Phytophthora megakarya]